MPERFYLGIVPIHGRTEVVKSQDLVELKQQINDILETPQRHYPHLEFQPEIYNVRPLRRRERRLLENRDG